MCEVYTHDLQVFSPFPQTTISLSVLLPLFIEEAVLLCRVDEVLLWEII